MDTIEIHPYDLAELVEQMAPHIPFVKDGVLWDIDGVRYHQNASVPRTPGKHRIE